MLHVSASLVRVLTVFFCALLLGNLGVQPAVAAAAGQGAILSSLRLPVYVWKQNLNPQAIVLALHGGCLHGRAYQALGEKLSGDGFMVVSIDMRGYGSWLHEGFGQKRDRTFNYKRSMGDIETVVQALRQDYPRTPVYVLGESLGANMAIHTAVHRPGLFDGLIVVSGYAGPKLFLHPRMLVHAFKIVTTPWRKLDTTPYLKNKLATCAIATQEHFLDPLGRDKQSIRELFRTFMVLRAGRRELSRVDIPILVIHGTADRLCSVDSMKKKFELIPSWNKQLVLLPEAGHLLVETSKLNDHAVEVIGKWLKVRSATPA